MYFEEQFAELIKSSLNLNFKFRPIFYYFYIFMVVIIFHVFHFLCLSFICFCSTRIVGKQNDHFEILTKVIVLSENRAISQSPSIIWAI